ncbi:MAG: 2-amino-4-hydroxy-6-hydroxymethyldihydropteridine diphosphokinase [Bacteroidetes bacterium]|nr:2-amino-4-hydroxy-6-hydroxymethyldihydropteridine diphosphokinase [Bacteroidota bacterium]
MKFILGLGSNLGNKSENLKLAISHIRKEIGKVTEISEFFQSKPDGFLSDNDFFNCCICVETRFSPLQLLQVIQQIEIKMGRRHSLKRYEDRIIDIDIILSELKVSSKKLSLPHPLYTKRDFVIVPLADLTGFQDPQTFITTSQLAL